MLIMSNLKLSHQRSIVDISANINISCHVRLFDWHNRNEHTVERCMSKNAYCSLMAQHQSPKNVNLCNDVVTKRFGQRRRTPRGHKKSCPTQEKRVILRGKSPRYPLRSSFQRRRGWGNHRRAGGYVKRYNANKVLL